MAPLSFVHFCSVFISNALYALTLDYLVKFKRSDVFLKCYVSIFLYTLSRKLERPWQRTCIQLVLVGFVLVALLYNTTRVLGFTSYFFHNRRFITQ
jgi:hypothetical protein